MARKPRKRQPNTELNPMQQRFVNAYASDPRSNGARSAVVAGYSPKNARKSAHNLLQRAPVKAAIARIRESLAESGKFDAIAAMRRLDEAAQFARDTGNATALARCIELQLRLHGLLIDRAQVQVERIDIGDAIATARGRVFASFGQPVQDADFTMIPRPRAAVVDPFE